MNLTHSTSTNSGRVLKRNVDTIAKAGMTSHPSLTVAVASLLFQATETLKALHPTISVATLNADSVVRTLIIEDLSHKAIMYSLGQDLRRRFPTSRIIIKC